MNKILLINPFGIGDLLFSTALIRPLKQRFPGVGLYFICNKRTVDILDNNPFIERVYVFEKGDYKELWRSSKAECIKRFLKFLGHLKEERFNAAIDMSLGHQYGFFLKLIGVPERIGFDYKGRGRFLTKRLPFEGFEGRPIAEHYGDLLKFLDPALKPAKETLIYITVQDSTYADKFLGDNGMTDEDTLIGIAPGGGVSFGISNMHFKRWPERSFADLAKSIVKELGAKVLVIWGPGEEALAAGITGDARGGVFMAPPTTIRQMAALMRRCKAVVANDAGPLHVAAAAGVKVLGIFGPADEKVYGPYPPSGRAMTAAHDIRCRPCYKRFRVPDCKDRVCLTDLAVNKVLGMVEGLIGR